MTKQLKTAILDLLRDCDKQGISKDGYYKFVPGEKVEEVRYWFEKEVRKHGQVQYLTLKDAAQIVYGTVPSTGKGE